MGEGSACVCHKSAAGARHCDNFVAVCANGGRFAHPLLNIAPCALAGKGRFRGTLDLVENLCLENAKIASALEESEKSVEDYD